MLQSHLHHVVETSYLLCSQQTISTNQQGNWNFRQNFRIFKENSSLKFWMDRNGWPLLIALVICVNAKSFSNGPLIPYNIDTSQTTVSGLSSGACMATQYHVAHSSQIRGAAIIAGCAYYCANANLPTALLCMDGAAVVPELVAATNYAALTLSIDSPSHMKDDLVWLFSGTSDSVVNSKAVEAVESYYSHFLDSTAQIYSEYSIPAAHGWPTFGEGSSCSNFSTPYVNNCSYSSSGKFLSYFYGGNENPQKVNPDNLFAFDQSLYTPGITPASISMDQTGFVYVPTTCQNGEQCKLHICFHGCEQGYQYVQGTFINDNQLNNYAEANNIIILYPQAVSTAVTNPKGCWDWWAYTGVDYATKWAPQISSVYAMTQAIIKQN